MADHSRSLPRPFRPVALTLTLALAATLARGQDAERVQPPTPPVGAPTAGTSVVPATPVPVGEPATPPVAVPQLALRRPPVVIDPKTPLKDLLPRAPKADRRAALPGSDLSEVPEVALREPAAALNSEKAFEEVARQVASVQFVNREKRDHFMSLLIDERSDLRGLPFLLGDACRSKGERLRHFALAAQALRQTTGGQPEARLTTEQADQVWVQFRTCCDRVDREPQSEEDSPDHASPARVAALGQILAPASPSMRIGQVKYLAGVSHVDATRALARLTLFAPEEEVRKAAAAALQVRRERDYTEVLLDGFRYPWPAVPKRAAEALVRLERKDLAGRLVDVLGEPDPSAPVTKTVKGKPVNTVRELVRINHHRNCLLCHAPASPDLLGSDTPVAAVPIPGQPLPSNGGYRQDMPETLVRLDVTYLRQDFSLLQPVAEAHPWPRMQRFDFLVRSRELGDDEAEEFKRLLARREPGTLPPNHKAALLALRELTGKDAAPTAEAWRRLLDLRQTRP